MEIVPFEPQMAAGVARCYNELVEGVPYCCPVAAEQFSSLECLACPLCREESLLVAQEADGNTIGFVHAGVAAPPGAKERFDEGEPGIIRFLAHRPGQRSVGQALLEVAESWVHERGRPRIMAWSNDYVYPFYHSPFAHLSDRIGHVRPLFHQAGYSMLFSELIFDWPDFDPPRVQRPDFDFALTREWRDDVTMRGRKVRPALLMKAAQGEDEIGLCEMTGWWQGSVWPEAADWCLCAHLTVKEALQRRGLGKFLLAAGLAEMRKAGFRHAGISTDWDNYRAQLLYTNFGFSFRDRTFAFRKELGRAEAGGAAQGIV